MYTRRGRSRLVSLFLCAALVGAAACGDDGGPNFQDDHPRIYLPRNRDRLAALVAANDPAWTRFKDIVDAQLGGADIYDFKAWFAALVGQLTGEDRYCEAAVAQIDREVTEERLAITAGQTPRVAYDSYLEIGARLGDLAITYDWCFETASREQKTRWLEYANQAIWNVWNHEAATWGGRETPWSGWSVDNPSNNYYYSFLRATMLVGLASRGEVPEGELWTTKFRDEKILGQLVPTFMRDLEGGGSREGTGYGVAMKNLWELYDLWHGSTGEQLADDTGHARASMLHLMHSTVPTLDRVAPIGDHARDSTAAWFDYHRQYLQELVHLFRDDPIAPHAVQLLASSSVPEHDTPFMYVYDFLYRSEVAPRPLAELGRAYFGPGTGHLFARSAWTEDATWIGFIAGPYSESHAHHDQGSILVYKDGWLAYDAVIDSSSGLSLESDAHSLVRFVEGGETVRMREGTTSEMRALARGPGWLHAAGDLTPSFGETDAVARWQREIVFLEPDVLIVYDRATSAPGVEQVWQLVAPTAFSVNGARASTVGTAHTLHVQRLLPAGATGAARGLTGDLDGAFRFDDTIGGGAHAHLHVVWIDNAVGTATAADEGTRDGVALTLGDGRTATVRFERDAIGGTLSIRGGAGDVDATLDAGVDALPERE